MDGLPYDVILYIVFCLEHLHDVIAFSETCKCMYESGIVKDWMRNARALKTAARQNMFDVVTSIIADMNIDYRNYPSKEECDETFVMASGAGEIGAMRMLLDWRTASSKTTHDALYAACKNGQLQAARMLIEELGEMIFRLEPSLHAACRNGHSDVVKLLLELLCNGPSVSDEALDKAAALARRNGHEETVRVLIEEADATLEE